jgi:hypothetical protein
MNNTVNFNENANPVLWIQILQDPKLLMGFGAEKTF